MRDFCFLGYRCCLLKAVYLVVALILNPVYWHNRLYLHFEELHLGLDDLQSQFLVQGFQSDFLQNDCELTHESNL